MAKAHRAPVRRCGRHQLRLSEHSRSARESALPPISPVAHVFAVEPPSSGKSQAYAGQRRAPRARAPCFPGSAAPGRPVPADGDRHRPRRVGRAGPAPAAPPTPRRPRRSPPVRGTCRRGTTSSVADLRVGPHGVPGSAWAPRVDDGPEQPVVEHGARDGEDRTPHLDPATSAPPLVTQRQAADRLGAGLSARAGSTPSPASRSSTPAAMPSPHGLSRGNALRSRISTRDPRTRVGERRRPRVHRGTAAHHDHVPVAVVRAASAPACTMRVGVRRVHRGRRRRGVELRVRPAAAGRRWSCCTGTRAPTPPGTGSRRYWSRRHTVVCPDLRGYGRSVEAADHRRPRAVLEARDGRRHAAS